MPVIPACLVRVVVCEANDDEADAIHDRTGDHNYADFRDWIRDTIHWAVRNGKMVTIEPAP